MDTFRWISVVVAMILGLGVARLLASAITVFRARRRTALDWPPLVWAAAIFVQQVTFWWSLEEAGSLIGRWTFPAFLLLVGLVLALFVAAALILPFNDMADGQSLAAYFREDGRWALLALAAFNAIAIVGNSAIWREGLLSESVSLNLALTVLPIAGFFGSRRVQAFAALVYLVVAVWGAIALSPAAY